MNDFTAEKKHSNKSHHSDGSCARTADRVDDCARSEGLKPREKVSAIGKSDSDFLQVQSKIQLKPSLGFPHLQIDDEIAPPVPAATTPEKLKKDWVVSLDLTIHLGSDTAQEQQRRLKALAARTSGKSVALVVQDVEPTSSGTGQELHRYIIADGTIKQLATEEAKGFAADAGSLVSKAKELVDAKSTAFIELGHGSGNSGFMGDDGHDEAESLAKALKAGNGGKLDDIVLDSCLVAQDGAIKALAGAAKDDIVASAEVGGSEDNSIRGLNYEKTLEKLIADPSMDGKAFAKQFVEDGKTGANIYKNSAGKPESGIKDLSAFDPSEVDVFEEKFGKFGDALAGAEKIEGNRKALQKLISNSYRYNLASAADQKRDLSAFARAVQDAVQSGALKDPTHLLAAATREVLDAQKDMTNELMVRGNLQDLAV